MNQNWALNGVDGVDLSIFENIGSLTILFSLKGKILYTNSMCSEELGYHLEDLQEMKIWDLIPKEELKRFKEKITYIQENKDTASLTIDLLNKQADRTAYSSTLSMTKHNGDKMLILGIFRGIIQLDIEQEIIAQKSQLNEEKLMLKRIIEKNPYGVCIFDKKGDYLDSNDNFKHLGGESIRKL
jgi:PAS domain S-box-containing protein